MLFINKMQRREPASIERLGNLTVKRIRASDLPESVDLHRVDAREFLFLDDE